MAVRDGAAWVDFVNVCLEALLRGGPAVLEMSQFFQKQCGHTRGSYGNRKAADA